MARSVTIAEIDSELREFPLACVLRDAREASPVPDLRTPTCLSFLFVSC
jgi:hypothetical protein